MVANVPASPVIGCMGRNGTMWLAPKVRNTNPSKMRDTRIAYFIRVTSYYSGVYVKALLMRLLIA